MKNEKGSITKYSAVKTVAILSAIIVVLGLLCYFFAFAKYVKTTTNNVTVGFREIKIDDADIIVDSTTFPTNSYIKTTITTQENLTIQYKIDSGEWTTYTDELHITDDCTLYARLTDGTNNYPEMTKQITIPTDLVVATSTKGGVTKKHGNVQDAINYIGNGQTDSGSIMYSTVTLQKTSITEAVTIAAGQCIVLDTKGKTLTSTGTTITNNGSLQVRGSGTISATGENIAINMEGGQIEVNGAHIIGGTTTSITEGVVSGGTAIKATNSYVLTNSGTITGGIAIAKSGSGSIDIYGGTITATEGHAAIILEPGNTGSLLMDNGTVSGNNASAIFNYSSANMNFGINNNSNNCSITTTGENAITVAETSTCNIEIGRNGVTSETNPSITGRVANWGTGEINMYSGKVTSSAVGALASGGTINITGGLIECSGEYGVVTTVNGDAINISGGTINHTGTVYGVTTNNSATSTINITGGEINSAATGVNNFLGTTTISGGTINATNGEGVHTTTGTITIGTNEETPSVSTTVPSITSGTYGITKTDTTTGAINFYDGVLKGKTEAINYAGTATTPTNYSVMHSIEGDYEKAILGLTSDIVATSTVSKITKNHITVQDAINARNTSNSYTQVTLQKASITEAVTIATGQNIILNTNGKTLTSTGTTITNNGTLTITGTGTISATGLNIAINNIGTAGITVSNGNIIGGPNTSATDGVVTGGAAIRSANGTVTINGGALSGGRALVKSGSGTTTITGGTHPGSNGYTPIIIEPGATGALNITGGTITSTGATDGAAISSYGTGTITVTGGTITSDSKTSIIAFSSNIVIGTSGNTSKTNPSITGRVSCSGTNKKIDMYSGKVTNTTESAIRASSGTINISGGLIEADSNYAVITETATSVINITGGEINYTGTEYAVTTTNATGGIINISGGVINSTGRAVNNQLGTTTITGGTITSTDEIGVYTITGTITIGTNGGTPSTTVPNITGGTVGAYKSDVSTGKLNFYDGVIKGPANNSILGGTAIAVQSGYGIQRMISGTVETATLVVPNYQNTTSSSYFATLQNAIAGSAAGTQIKLLKTLTDSSTATIGKNLTLNVQTYTLTRSATITVNSGSKLTVTGTTGKITSASSHIIATSGDVDISGGTLHNTNSTAQASIYNIGTGTVTVKGGTVKGDNGSAINIENTGKAIVSSGTVTGGTRGIYGSNAGTVTVSGGTVTGATCGIENTTGSVTASGGIITGSEYGILTTSGAVISSGATINATATTGIGIQTTSGKVTASAGTIKCGTSSVLTTGVVTGASAIRTATGAVEIKGATINCIRAVVKSGAGTVTMSSGTITTVPTGYIPIVLETNSGANCVITGGTITTTAGSGIINYSTGTITIGTSGNTSTTSPSITGAITGNIENQSGEKNGIVNIYSGKIVGTSTTAVYNNGDIRITGGEITASANYSVYSANVPGTITISGGTINNTSAERQAVTTTNNVPGSAIRITGGTINSNSIGVNNFQGTITVSGGTINAVGIGIYSTSGTVTVTGGQIASTTKQGIYIETGTVTIGTTGGGAPTQVPIINGTTYGVQKTDVSTGKVYYYDGKLSGATAISAGTSLVMESGYDMQKTVASSIETVFLVGKNFLNTTSGSYYGSIASAISESASGSTIQLIKNNYPISSINPTIPSGKTLTFNLNGNTMVFTGRSLINNGTLTITGAGKMTGSTADVIQNNGTFTKSGTFTIENTATATYVPISNAGTATISAGTITGSYVAVENTGTGKLTISGATINSTASAINNSSTVTSTSTPAVKVTSGSITSTTNYGIYNSGTGTVVMSGGTINGATRGINNNSTGIINVSGGTITAGTSTGIYTGTGSCTITGSATSPIITSASGSAVSVGGGTLTIKGGKITGKTNGVYVNGGTLTLGTNETTPSVSTTTPSITGTGTTTSYGVRVSTGTVNFYDGVIKGADTYALVAGTVNKPTGYVVQKTTANSVQTAILVAQ